MKFTDTHEWIDVQDDVGTVGVTDHAQSELGEVVFVELPKVGKQVKAQEEAAVLESTKAAADVYSPVTGTILEVNQKLSEASDLINRSPQKEGWIFRIKLTDLKELDQLMDEATYRSKLS
jgi:glycine cleavage system H protein